MRIESATYDHTSGRCEIIAGGRKTTYRGHQARHVLAQALEDGDAVVRIIPPIAPLGAPVVFR